MSETWTFTGQPWLRWPRWVQEACSLGRAGPVFRGQVVYPGEKLTLVEDNIIEHELIGHEHKSER